MQKGFGGIIILVVVVIVGVAAGAYYLGVQKSNENYTMQSPGPSALPSPTPSSTSSETSNWKTYTNAKYGFEISYPESYKVLEDKQSLGGWPRAIALLYNGGQAYDIVIEVWNNELEYKDMYRGNRTLTVKKVNDNYLTVLNNTDEEENARIINTFKFTE